MPVILAITYQKKLGLPNYSSHSCSASLTVEIPDVSVFGQETSRIYEFLQSSVDAEIQNVGFMPDATTYGMNNGNGHPSNGNGHSRPQNGNGYRPNGNGHHAPQQAPQRSNTNQEMWNCTDGQKGLILKVVNESKMPKEEVENLAQQMLASASSSSIKCRHPKSSKSCWKSPERKCDGPIGTVVNQPTPDERHR